MFLESRSSIIRIPGVLTHPLKHKPKITIYKVEYIFHQVPLEMREQVPERAVKANKLTVFGDESKIGSKIQLAGALEAGRIVSRDIGGSDPERMAAPKVEEYVIGTFKDTNVKIEVMKGQKEVFEKEYPCLAAVNRSASGVTR